MKSDQVLYEMRFNIPNGDAESLNEKMLGKLQIHPGSEEKVITSFEDLKFQIPR